MERTDSRLTLVAAFACDKSVDYRDWPNVATYLLTIGYDGDALRELAGLDLAPFDSWDTDALVPAVLAELDAPELDEAQALGVVTGCVARLASLGALTDASAARVLATTYIEHGYPRQPPALGDVYYAEEFLDCDCHDPTDDLRDAVAELDANVPADADLALLRQLLGLRSTAE